MKLPPGSIMVSNVLVVEFMSPDGELHVEAECYDSAGADLELGKHLELLEEARMKAIAPRLAQHVARFCMEDFGE